MTTRRIDAAVAWIVVLFAAFPWMFFRVMSNQLVLTPMAVTGLTVGYFARNGTPVVGTLPNAYTGLSWGLQIITIIMIFCALITAVIGSVPKEETNAMASAIDVLQGTVIGCFFLIYGIIWAVADNNLIIYYDSFYVVMVLIIILLGLRIGHISKLA